MLTRIDHVGIACHDLDAAVVFYTGTFGLTVASVEVNEDQGVREAMLELAEPAADAEPTLDPGTVVAPAGAGTLGPGTAMSLPTRVPGTPSTDAATSYVQLLQPTRADSPVGRFLASRGEGIHHVGYRVVDIAAALKTIGAEGIRLIDERPRHGSMGAAIAFLHPSDMGGVLTELVQPQAPGQ